MKDKEVFERLTQNKFPDIEFGKYFLGSGIHLESSTIHLSSREFESYQEKCASLQSATDESNRLLSR